MNWIAGYVLFSIALCLLTVAAHDISAWLSKRPVNHAHEELDPALERTASGANFPKKEEAKK